jgi:hypothetical protein
MKSKNRIVYSIDVEDLQNVADQEIDRELTEKEIELIENRLGDFLDWYGAIASAINCINLDLIK